MFAWLSDLLAMLGFRRRETSPSGPPTANRPAPSPGPVRAPRPTPPPVAADRAPPPASVHQPPPAAPAPVVEFEPVDVEVVKEQASGSHWFAVIDGERFKVGDEVTYAGSNRGLQLLAPPGCLVFDPNEFRAEHGILADMIAVTSDAEGKRDLCPVNTYDGAIFTFGLMQWAAHTANENFILLFREWLRLPSARAYFPDLALDAEGRICKRTERGLEQLETARSPLALQRYLNPDSRRVDREEVVSAAKLVHWVKHVPEARQALLRFTFEHYKSTLREVHRGLKRNGLPTGLDGRTDVEALVCADIRHQGRGKYTEMVSALNKTRSVEALLAIGGSQWRHRTRLLLEKITEAQDQDRLGRHRYRAEDESWVPIEEASAERFQWPEAHLVPSGRSVFTRQDPWGARKLNEPGAPARNPSGSPEQKAQALREIALWLDPVNSNRYQRQPLPSGADGPTRCNIYAYDFACLAGAYLPRVWWKPSAIDDIDAGRTPSVDYRPPSGGNVKEQSANELMYWFLEHSAKYGWRRVSSLDELQAHANAGGVAIIVGRNCDPNSSGHISVVVPEGEAAGQSWTAKRENGQVQLPLQSQAGRRNYCFGHDRAWWADRSLMADHGFWIHD